VLQCFSPVATVKFKGTKHSPWNFPTDAPAGGQFPKAHG